MTRLEGVMHRAGVIGLDPDHLHLGEDPLHVCTDACRQAPTANADEDCIQVLRAGDLLHNLHGACAVASNHVRVVKGVDHNAPSLFMHPLTLRFGTVEIIANQYHLRPQVLDVLPLDSWGDHWHKDGRRDAKLLGRQGHPLGMIASGAGQHPTKGPLLVGHVDHTVVAAPALEREHRLRVLPFEVDLILVVQGKIGGKCERCLLTDIIDPGAQDQLQVVRSLVIPQLRCCARLEP
mmetsp:Transcript_154164/g.269675  ORF Transcript_154164/g.269675 Transcript_154164/m.269675 type:complete len:235 (+) Transcript_154164:963-1667(+)